MVAEAKQKTAALDDFINNSAKKYYIKAKTLDVQSIREHVDELTEGSRSEGYYIDHLGLPFGMYALLTDDPIGMEYARQILLSFVGKGADWSGGAGDGYVTGRLFAVGLLYDWVHSNLSEDMKKSVREYLLDSLEYLDVTKGQGYLLNPKRFTGGHAHYANIYALAALLAIRHDIEQDSASRQDQYFYFLGKVVSNWINGYNPLLAWVSEGGGHHMGWHYGQAYTRSYPYLLWEYATNETSWFTGWQNQRPFFYLYGLRQLNSGVYDMYPNQGDSSGANWSPSRSGLEAAVAASHYGNPYAAWLVENLGASHFAKLFYAPEGWPAVAAPDRLPLARHFQNSGQVVMRDTWDFDENTLVVFKSSPFYSFTHHHRDENAFTIFYRGPLAIDSGAYTAGGAYGSEHWYNYYIRSVAHNTILVYDPKEHVRGLKGTIVSIDGGQKLLANTEPTYEQMLPGGAHHLDGILRFENHDDYTYTVGDATKAYDSGKVSDFKRTIIYLRDFSYNHPLILVHDRVVSTDPRFRKTYLLHSINEPQIEGAVARLSISALPNPMATLFQETILPRNPRINVIGGRKNGQDFYVGDDGRGAPHNYSEGVLYDDSRDAVIRGLREAGEWRVEVSPSVPAKDDTFLHALAVTDQASNNERATVQYVSSPGIDGVVVNDADGVDSALVLLRKESGPLLEEIDLSGTNDFDKVLIVGLDSETTYSIGMNGNILLIRNDLSGNITSSDQGTIYADAVILLGPDRH
jgi:hypothetical protein